MTPEAQTFRIPDFSWLTRVTPGKLKDISASRQEGKSLAVSTARVIEKEAGEMLRSLPPPSKGFRLGDLHRSITEADIKKTIFQIAVEDMSKTPENGTDKATWETLDTLAVIEAVRKQIKYFNRELIPRWYNTPSSLIRVAENYPRRGALLEPTLHYNNLVIVMRVMDNFVRERIGTSKIGFLPLRSLDYEEIIRENCSNLQALQKSLSAMLSRRVPTQVIDFCTKELQHLYPSLDEVEKEALERGRKRFHQLYNAAQETGL